MDDVLDYPRLLRGALLGVVRQALRLVAENGLPGEHHFYVTFRTGHPGVALSKALRAQHPEEMTVVLQHQFWDLEVTDESFSVSLRFGGRSHSVTVPFAAVTAFADPAAQIGLRFEPAGHEAPPASAPGAPRPDNVIDMGAFRKGN